MRGGKLRGIAGSDARWNREQHELSPISSNSSQYHVPITVTLAPSDRPASTYTGMNDGSNKLTIRQDVICRSEFTCG